MIKFVSLFGSPLMDYSRMGFMMGELSGAWTDWMDDTRVPVSSFARAAIPER